MVRALVIMCMLNTRGRHPRGKCMGVLEALIINFLVTFVIFLFFGSIYALNLAGFELYSSSWLYYFLDHGYQYTKLEKLHYKHTIGFSSDSTNKCTVKPAL